MNISLCSAVVLAACLPVVRTLFTALDQRPPTLPWPSSSPAPDDVPRACPKCLLLAAACSRRPLSADAPVSDDSSCAALATRFAIDQCSIGGSKPRSRSRGAPSSPCHVDPRAIAARAEASTLLQSSIAAASSISSLKGRRLTTVPSSAAAAAAANADTAADVVGGGGIAAAALQLWHRVRIRRERECESSRSEP